MQQLHNACHMITSIKPTHAAACQTVHTSKNATKNQPGLQHGKVCLTQENNFHALNCISQDRIQALVIGQLESREGAARRDYRANTFTKSCQIKQSTAHNHRANIHQMQQLHFWIQPIEIDLLSSLFVNCPGSFWLAMFPRTMNLQ